MLWSLLGMVAMAAVELPMGSAPAPVVSPHFPDRMHAYVWRNWTLVPVERLAEVVEAKPEDLTRMAEAMGLCPQPAITGDQFKRSSLTIIKHNWQLLPYEQLLTLLDWTPEQMVYHLREDDFLFIKLGNLKPKCDPLVYAAPSPEILEREAAIGAFIREQFPEGAGAASEPAFGFIADLAAPLEGEPPAPMKSRFSPRFCFSYFGMTGDPFLGSTSDTYPDGLLARLAASGVDGVWLQGVLYTLAPFPWDESRSARYEERLENLRELVARAKKHGIRLYLYLNEPRAMPVAFFEGREDLRGVTEGDYAALCTSNPDVQRFIRESVASICRAVPDLGGFFSISGSENLTNCWSHYQGANCPRCGRRTPGEVIAEVNGLFLEGIREAGGTQEMIAWDWGWQDTWAPDVIANLPRDVAVMSVSEWSTPIHRGGVETTVGEYSISVIGPGPRATKHWALARERGMKTLAKLQVGTTWELGSVPYIPAVANVAQHIANLRDVDVSGFMLGWTLGGYPSPNLEVTAVLGAEGNEAMTPDEAMQAVAVRRFGEALAPAVVAYWKSFSTAIQEFPFSGGLIYTSPVHMGPATPLWAEPTGYAATMVGFPYDDLTSWRACYPEEAFIGQFRKMAVGFEEAIAALKADTADVQAAPAQHEAFEAEVGVAETCAIHYASVANLGQFVRTRGMLAGAKSAAEAAPLLDTIEQTLRDEMALARRLYDVQARDSRIGFEASNQYYYLPVDLAEAVLNIHDLLTRWIPEQRAKLTGKN